MGPLGLSISWRTPKMDAQGVGAVCRVSHELGHFEGSGEVLWLGSSSFEGASMTFSTFSESLMREAIGRMGSGVESEIAYTQKTVGNQSFNNIDAIRDAEIAF